MDLEDTVASPKSSVYLWAHLCAPSVDIIQKFQAFIMSCLGRTTVPNLSTLFRFVAHSTGGGDLTNSNVSENCYKRFNFISEVSPTMHSDSTMMDLCRLCKCTTNILFNE